MLGEKTKSPAAEEGSRGNELIEANASLLDKRLDARVGDFRAAVAER